MKTEQKLHFIAIGGSVMHNLAIDAQQKGYQVTGSDDEIFEPSKSKLDNLGLLPKEDGWFPEKVTEDLDFVIVGMHAKADNPELKKAQDLQLKVLSFPQYIYENSKNKQRVVIAGSHGKTTITALLLHVLRESKRKFDYVVGASLEGFDNMVKLSEEAPLIIIEGDEYLSAPFDATPKFLHYKHHVGLISGVAWDHANVYPTIDDYVIPFEQFADSTPKAGSLILSQEDSITSMIGANEREDVTQILYQTHSHKVEDGTTFLTTSKFGKIELNIFGEHNMKNIAAAKAVCSRIGLPDSDFYKAIATFKGASRRLEKIEDKGDFTFFRDYAHSPSKLLASTTAVKKQYIQRKLVGCLELHTYSSLNKNFLKQYKDKFNAADRAIIYFNPKKFELKKLPPLQEDDIREAFGHENLLIFNDIEDLKKYILRINWQHKNLLMMSSGNFDNLDFKALAKNIKNE